MTGVQNPHNTTPRRLKFLTTILTRTAHCRTIDICGGGRGSWVKWCLGKKTYLVEQLRISTVQAAPQRTRVRGKTVRGRTDAGGLDLPLEVQPDRRRPQPFSIRGTTDPTIGNDIRGAFFDSDERDLELLRVAGPASWIPHRIRAERPLHAGIRGGSCAVGTASRTGSSRRRLVRVPRRRGPYNSTFYRAPGRRGPPVEQRTV